MLKVFYAWLFISLVSFLCNCQLTYDDIADDEADPNGYLFFCLCMGRLGNQMEHFLGSLAFAKQLNRTLILPPFRTYMNVEYDEWFSVEALSAYHKVITAKHFMTHIAPSLWPPNKRYGFCYVLPENQNKPCEMKIGNPFTNFWDELHVDFVESFSHSISYTQPAKFQEHFPANKFPVIALKGAPASFPMQSDHVHLQQFVDFSESLIEETEHLISAYLNGSKNYVGIHLRNGPDWINACKLVGSVNTLMSSYQCQGFKNRKTLTQEMCFPSETTVVKTVKDVVSETGVDFLLVATDQNPMLDIFRRELPHIAVVHLDPRLPILDVVLLSESKHFIGNCVSSFSAFVWRQRLHHNKGKTTHFGCCD